MKFAALHLKIHWPNFSVAEALHFMHMQDLEWISLENLEDYYELEGAPTIKMQKTVPLFLLKMVHLLR